MTSAILQKTHKNIQRMYRWPKFYDRVYTRLLEGGRRAAIALLPEARPLNVLEVGIGTGLSLPYYPKDVELTGIDPSDEMLTIATERVPFCNAHVRLERMDGMELLYPDESFDSVVMLYVLNVAPNTEQLLREANRVLRPGGTMIIANHFKGTNPLIRHLTFLTQHMGYHTKLKLRDVTHAPGWTLKSCKKIGTNRVLVLEKI